MLYITKNRNQTDILDVESFFRVMARDHSLFENDECKRAMKTIDHAKYMGDGIIKTPIGTATITELSTGCKTILLLLLYANKKEHTISIMECGENALNYIFASSEGLDFHVFLNCGIVLQQDYSCVIDGKRFHGAVDIYHALEEEDE